MRIIVAITALALSAPVAASSPQAEARGLEAAKQACRKASDFRNAATLGTPLMFSDVNGKTAILVTGTWRPRHMHGARGTMLCLYDRKSQTAEVQEAAQWSVGKPAPGG